MKTRRIRTTISISACTPELISSHNSINNNMENNKKFETKTHIFVITWYQNSVSFFDIKTSTKIIFLLLIKSLFDYQKRNSNRKKSLQSKEFMED